MHTKAIAGLLAASISLGVAASAHAQGSEMSRATSQYDSHTAFRGNSGDGSPSMMPYWNVAKVVLAAAAAIVTAWGTPEQEMHGNGSLAGSDRLFDAPR